MDVPRRLLALCLLPLALALGGCPHHVDELAKEIVPPRDYKPIYMTSTIPYEKMLEEYRASGGRPHIPASTGSRTGDSSSGPAPLLSMDIRNVDDTRYPKEIELRAFIYDSTGRFVMGMAPPYFKGPGEWRTRWPRLIDSCGGVATVIDSFNVTEVRQDKREPYAIAFVLDHSGSMGDTRIRNLRSAVSRILKVIKKGDQIATVKFGDRAAADVPLTADSARYRNDFIVENLEPPGGGGTAIYDAGITGINELGKAPVGHKRAMILFTDGFDGSSKQSIDSLHRLAREQRVTIYTVAYGQADVKVLGDIASYTGGRMYRIYSNKEFPYVFADIYRALNNYYRITYRPPECAGIHTATVSVSLPELGFDPLLADGSYDRSLFTPFDPVGAIALVGIEFDYNKATIRAESMDRVREVGTVMKTYPNMKLEIRGHTDDQGGEEYNLKLSGERASAVADELARLGVDRSRLNIVGHGESRPLASNDSEENRRRNRRTEFVIISR